MNKNIVEIRSQEVSRVILTELRRHPENLPAELQFLLTNKEAHFDRAICSSVVWVDMTGVVATGKNYRQAQLTEQAVRLFIRHGAHHEMLHRLFKLTRKEFSDLKKHLHKKTLTRPPKIPDKVVTAIFEDWRLLSIKHKDDEIKRWLEMADRYKKIRLSSIYQLIKGESS